MNDYWWSLVVTGCVIVSFFAFLLAADRGSRRSNVEALPFLYASFMALFGAAYVLLEQILEVN